MFVACHVLDAVALVECMAMKAAFAVAYMPVLRAVRLSWILQFKLLPMRSDAGYNRIDQMRSKFGKHLWLCNKG